MTNAINRKSFSKLEKDFVSTFRNSIVVVVDDDVARSEFVSGNVITIGQSVLLLHTPTPAPCFFPDLNPSTRNFLWLSKSCRHHVETATTVWSRTPLSLYLSSQSIHFFFAIFLMAFHTSYWLPDPKVQTITIIQSCTNFVSEFCPFHDSTLIS